MLSYGGTTEYLHVSASINFLPIWFRIQYLGAVKLMNVRDVCYCGSGKEMGLCHPNTNENSLVGKLLSLYAQIDARNSKAKTVCKKGCAECCSDDFEVHLSEFLTILDHLGITDDMEDYKRSMNRKNWDSLMESKNLRTDGTCLFLEEQCCECRIYSVRPIICRNYGSTWQDSKMACSKLYYATEPIELINIEEYPINTSDYRLYTSGKIDGQEVQVRSTPFPLTLWVKKFSVASKIMPGIVKSLLQASTSSSIDDFLVIFNTLCKQWLDYERRTLFMMSKK